MSFGFPGGYRQQCIIWFQSCVYVIMQYIEIFDCTIMENKLKTTTNTTTRTTTIATTNKNYYYYCCYYTWWRHQMETCSALLALCAGNSPVPVNSPHKGQWRGALMFSLICAWISDWVNNREAGDLRRHRGHYDVIVMTWEVVTKYDSSET